MFSIKNIFKNIDWVLFLSVVLISLAGLITMNSFTETSNYFSRQIIWIIVSCCVFMFASGVDWSFMKNSRIIVISFLVSTLLLFLLFVLGSVFKGAQSWFDLGAFSFQPVDIVKLVVILLLSKYILDFCQPGFSYKLSGTFKIPFKNRI